MIPLLHARHDQCREPFGSMCCGKPVDSGSSYCCDHREKNVAGYSKPEAFLKRA